MMATEDRKYMTVADAAKRISVCQRTIRKAMASGRLTQFRVGRRVLVAVAELDAMVERSAQVR